MTLPTPTPIVTATLDASSGLDTLRTGAACMPIRDTGWIAVTGGDRVRWLNGMVTNSVQALAPGEGAYSFLLNAQGRIQADCTVWAERDRLLLQTDAAQVAPMVELLDRFIIMDDVELADVSTEWYGVVLAGPEAPFVLAAIGIPARAGKLLRRREIVWQSKTVVLVDAYSPAVPRFELWSRSAGDVAALLETLGRHVPHATPEAFELLRILERRPAFGTDIRDRDLPQETDQTRALHFAKGCYLGQEIVERIRSRGQVHRTFTAFQLTGEVPQPGTELQAEGKAAGLLTTVAANTIGGKRFALGYVRRELLERGLPLTFPGGSAEALPATLASKGTSTHESEPNG